MAELTYPMWVFAPMSEKLFGIMSARDHATMGAPMDNATVALVGQFLIAAVLALGGIFAIGAGYRLYREGAGLNPDPTNVQFKKFKITTSSVGATVMLTAFGWGWLATTSLPEITAAADGSFKVTMVPDIEDSLKLGDFEDYLKFKAAYSRVALSRVATELPENSWMQARDQLVYAASTSNSLDGTSATALLRTSTRQELLDYLGRDLNAAAYLAESTKDGPAANPIEVFNYDQSLKEFVEQLEKETKASKETNPMPVEGGTELAK